jgi:hypothetical protein
VSRYYDILTKDSLSAAYNELRSLRAVGRRFKVDPSTIRS